MSHFFKASLRVYNIHHEDTIAIALVRCRKFKLFSPQQSEEEASQGDKTGIDRAPGQLHAAQPVQADGPGGPG